MAISTINLPPFPKFDLDDTTTISTRRLKYKKRFVNLCIALNVQDQKQKLAMLLTYVGEEVYDIFDSCLNVHAEITYDDALKLPDGHFNPRVNTSYEVYLFRNLKQNTDESIQQFYIRIKQQSSKCDFGANLEK